MQEQFENRAKFTQEHIKAYLGKYPYTPYSDEIQLMLGVLEVEKNNFDKAKKIFEHFEKLDHYSPGLGLGLYVCNLIAQALGGEIYLDTGYTQGARFVFTVPNQPAETEAGDSDSENNIPS